MIKKLEKHRNFGISAHIDSGKTTLSERILYYTGKIYRIGEVKGGADTATATMDFMELEKERGITITSAATSCRWNDHTINLIDTPGHVDFTVEVERSLRVLDGAILVLCGVAGVQSQSITVDRQMKRYGIPRICFVNKLDRMGANGARVGNMVREKLGLNVVPLQIQIGYEENFKGVVDLVTMKAIYFEGKQGDTTREDEIPAELVDEANTAREVMLDRISIFDESLMEKMLEGTPIPVEELHTIIRRETLANNIVPLMMGSAFKNKGVQTLLDGVTNYLPSPLDRRVMVNDIATGQKVEVFPDNDKPLVAMAFKLVDENYGQLTYTRLYQGTLRKGESYTNTRTGKRVRVGRLVRMHADKREDEELATAGDIVAMVGVDCATGDTFCDGRANVSCEAMFVAEPVIEYSISAKKQDDASNLSKALGRFMREDPTFRVRVDPESAETIIAGMGELHLDIYIERTRREYKTEVVVGAPKVAYRETITQSANYDYKHKKQTGGSGQYGHVVGRLEPMEGHFEFEDDTVGGTVPKEFIPAVEKGFRDSLDKGPMAGFPVTGVKAILTEGSSHVVDSSEIAFRVAARMAFKQAFAKAGGIILEPIMLVEAETPNEFTGTVQGDLSSRRGLLLGSEASGDGYSVIRAEVPLSEMFGYSTDLRSRTQGKAGFTMEFAAYRQVPASIQQKLIEEAAKRRKGGSDDE